MFNKLVMESVDTQHSTELLDNLQIRTFDAFLLKGPRPSDVTPADTASCEGQAPSRDAAAWRPGQAARGKAGKRQHQSDKVSGSGSIRTTTRTAVASSAHANIAILSTGPDRKNGLLKILVK